MKKLIALICGLFLTACIDSVYKVPYTVDNIQHGKSYIGLYGQPAPIPQPNPQLPEKITIAHTVGFPTPDVYINGLVITDKFTKTASGSEVLVSDIKDVLRQGDNLLLVDPMKLGPTIAFKLDSRGPMIDVTSVTCQDGDCSAVNGGGIDLVVRATDTTSITNVSVVLHNYVWDGGTDGGANSRGIPFKIESITPTVTYPLTKNANGTWSGTIQEATLYEIVATDNYGYVSSYKFLSPKEKINNVFKLKINKSVMDVMVPTIAPMMEKLHIYAPDAMTNYGKAYPTANNPVANDILDTMSKFWRSDAIFYADMGAVTTNPANCGYINTNKWNGTAEGVYFNCTQWDGSRCRAGDWVIPSGIAYKSGECSRIVMWRMELDGVQDMTFTLRDDQVGMLNLDMKLVKETKPKALYADLGIRNIKCGKQSYSYSCGFFCSRTGYYTDNYCRDNGGVMAIPILGPNLGDMKVSADSGRPQGGIKVLIKDGVLDLGFDNVKLNLTGLQIGSGFDVFISVLSGLLDGLFVGIVQNTLRQNMEDFVLGADLFLDSDSQSPPDPSLRMQSQAYQVYTNADNNPATEVEWYMMYSGFFKALRQHSEVAPILGSRYVTEQIYEPVNSPSAVDVAINVNIINQALMSLYYSGVTHIAVTNLKADNQAKIHFGPSVTDALVAAEGDKRIELVPSTPATFEMGNAIDGSRATLYYRNAQMNIETFTGGVWKKDFIVNVDIKAGVYMTANAGKFQMTILGTPELSINSIQTEFLADVMNNVSFRNLVQLAVNLFLTIATPAISETFAEIDYPLLDGPEGTGVKIKLNTDKIEANHNEHLNFGLSITIQ